MKTKISILCGILWTLSQFSAFGQSKIEGDLVVLSELTLLKSPLIQRNALDIRQAEANFLEQRSAFDYHLSSGVHASKNNLALFEADPRSQVLRSNLETNSTDFTIEMQKRFRTGLIANLNTNYSQVSDNFPLNAFNEEVGANTSDHSTSVTLSLTQPLLKGNGFKVTTAFEKSANLEVESAHQNFELNTAFELLQTGRAYWQYLGAFKTLEILKENENRVQNVLEITQELVKADKKPESDLEQIKADLSEQKRQTTVAQQNLYSARINLGRVVGLSEEQSKNIGHPINEFPTIIESQFSKEIDVESMILLARKHRSDIKAVRNTQEALNLQLSAARNDILPKLDLSGFFSYGGSTVGGGLERLFKAFENGQGRNFITGLSLTFSLPVNNNLAQANLARISNVLSDQTISYENLLRNIDLNVSIALNNIENSVLILEKAKETLEYYQLVFNNEQIRFQNGLTTLLNLILLQERLTFAQLEYLRAQQQFAVSIINLRFETGTLISINTYKEIDPVQSEIFYHIPDVN